MIGLDVWTVWIPTPQQLAKEQRPEHRCQWL